jgi:hypothetical protein
MWNIVPQMISLFTSTVNVNSYYETSEISIMKVLDVLHHSLFCCFLCKIDPISSHGQCVT